MELEWSDTPRARAQAPFPPRHHHRARLKTFFLGFFIQKMLPLCFWGKLLCPCLCVPPSPTLFLGRNYWAYRSGIFLFKHILIMPSGYCLCGRFVAEAAAHEGAQPTHSDP